MMKSTLIFTIITLISLNIYNNQAQSYDFLKQWGLLESIPDDAYLTPRQLCQKYNYTFESHYVTTQDNYILEIFRIGSKTVKKQKVAFFQHCLLCTAHGFLAGRPSKAPAFRFVDNGYDVWLGNNRGSFYSRNHTTLNPDKDSEYWDFTWVQMGRHDVPAQVNYVHKYVENETGSSDFKMSYVGHSQGTIQMFLALSELEEELSKKISAFAAITPIARVYHMNSPIFGFLKDIHAADLVKALHINQFLPRWWLLSGAARWFCGDLLILCRGVLQLISEEKAVEDNMQDAAVFLSYAPAGTSSVNMQHWQQLTQINKFQYFDYGQKQNMQKYGQKTPPQVKVNDLKTIPIGLYIGKDDELGDGEDIAWLSGEIKNVLKDKKEYDAGHLSFLFGEDMSYVEDMIKFLDQQHEDYKVQSMEQ